MAQACPLAFRLIDGTLARLSTFFVSFSVIVFLMTDQKFFLYFLLVDFMMRLYGCKKYSLIHNLSIVTKRVFQFSTDMTDAGAKRLAAHFGVVFILLMILESIFHLQTLLFLTVTLFLICTSMEVVFAFCVGCKIYFIIKKIYPAFME